MALGTDHVSLEDERLDDKETLALAERVRSHFIGGGDLPSFLDKHYGEAIPLSLEECYPDSWL